MAIGQRPEIVMNCVDGEIDDGVSERLVQIIDGELVNSVTGQINLTNCSSNAETSVQNHVHMAVGEEFHPVG